MESIAGKIAWVTGAGTGIGQSGAVKLAGAGALVVLSGRSRGTLEATASDIVKSGGTAEIETCDVADAASVQRAADAILARHGRIDILVHSAGLNNPKRHWGDMDVEAWHNVVDADLNGAFYCCNAVIPAMRRQWDGLIVNISSMAGVRVGYVSGVSYTAAKHGLNALNETINIENCQYGIRACVICPGEVATPILDKRPMPPNAEARARMLQSEDLGETILFVATMPKRVCLNQIVVTPTWNRGNIGASPDQRPPVVEQPQG